MQAGPVTVGLGELIDVHPGHHEVQRDRVWAPDCDDGERLGTVGGIPDFKAFIAPGWGED